LKPRTHKLTLALQESQHSFIQKEVRLSSVPSSFQREKENLELLHCLKHPNIVELLCSYTTTSRTTTPDSTGTESTVIDHKYFFLFPEEALDLQRFLQTPQPYGLFDRKETYYLALQGLASALSNVHNIKINKAVHLVDFERVGSHRDIRPPNILVRPNTFLLADFGLTDFKDVNNDRGSKTVFKAGRGDYIAPECYGKAFDRQSVGRTMDIWAFGCILVEIATYMETGSDGLRKFQDTRIGPWLPPFNNGYFFHERALKPIILDHMSHLQESTGDHAYPNYSTWLNSCCTWSLREG
jgi:serine/threonine protein kinase